MSAPDKSAVHPSYRLIVLAGCASALIWGAVGWLSHGIGELPGFHYDNRNDDMPTGYWLTLHFLAGAILLTLICRIGRKSQRSIALPIIAFALVFRLILLPSVPIHENDFYRYLWDGQSTRAGINPYEFEPGALHLHENQITETFSDRQVPGVTWNGREFNPDEIERLRVLGELRDTRPEILARVGHPAVPTIYPPVAQAIFWLSTSLFGPSLLGLKFILLVFDVGIIVLIAQLLNRFRLSMSGLLIYAWNPLVLKEFANSAHYDAVPIFFTLLAVWLAVRQKKTAPAAPVPGSVFALASGTLSKYFSVLLLPILVPPQRRNWLPYTIFAATLVIAFLPFILWDSIGIGRVFAGLGIYNANWQYNALVFPIVHRALALAIDYNLAWTLAKMTMAASLLALVARLAFRNPARTPLRKVHHCAVCVGALFLLSPTAFPWYFCWVLPFVCLFPRWPWILLSLLLPLNYLDFHSAASMPVVDRSLLGFPVLSCLIWGGFLVALIAERLVSNRSLQPDSKR